MVATPLARQGSRRGLTNAVVAGLFGATISATARRWGGRRAATAALAVVTGTATLERIGSRTGWPFGRYRYTDALRPAVAGVPVAVPLAWFGMAVPARETAHGLVPSAVGRILLGGACLTAWDLFLDPQMVAEGYWRWERAGRYRGIPVTNFAGWLVTGVLACLALEALLPRGGGPPDTRLTSTYGVMGAMETLGFAAFFRDPLVAAVGGTAMLPPAMVAVARSGSDG
jgi:putative membrane protein